MGMFPEEPQSLLLNYANRFGQLPEIAGHLLKGMAEGVSPRAMLLRYYEAQNGPIPPGAVSTNDADQWTDKEGSVVDPGQSYRGGVLPFERSPEGKLSFSSPRLLDLFPTAGAEAGGAISPATEAGKTTLGTYAGPRARTAPLASLEDAKGMTKPLGDAEIQRLGDLSGNTSKTPAEIQEMSDLIDRHFAQQDPDFIRRKTGWHKAADDTWRHEISDHSAGSRDINDVLKEQSGGDPAKAAEVAHAGIPLNQILDHPDLFNAYPHLRDTRVYPTSMPPGEHAAFEHGTGRLLIDHNQLNSTEQLETILHEVQHSVGQVEGQHPGGNPVMSEINYSPEWDAEVRRLTDLHRQQTGRYPKMDELDNIHQEASMQIYRRLLGEVTARDTESRRPLDPGQRRELKPYVSQGIPAKDIISHRPLLDWQDGLPPIDPEDIWGKVGGGR